MKRRPPISLGLSTGQAEQEKRNLVIQKITKDVSINLNAGEYEQLQHSLGRYWIEAAKQDFNLDIIVTDVDDNVKNVTLVNLSGDQWLNQIKPSIIRSLGIYDILQKVEKELLKPAEPSAAPAPSSGSPKA